MWLILCLLIITIQLGYPSYYLISFNISGQIVASLDWSSVSLSFSDGAAVTSFYTSKFSPSAGPYSWVLQANVVCYTTKPQSTMSLSWGAGSTTAIVSSTNLYVVTLPYMGFITAPFDSVEDKKNVKFLNKLFGQRKNNLAIEEKLAKMAQSIARLELPVRDLQERKIEVEVDDFYEKVEEPPSMGLTLPSRRDIPSKREPRSSSVPK